jgi:hypothetical protein
MLDPSIFMYGLDTRFTGLNDVSASAVRVNDVSVSAVRVNDVSVSAVRVNVENATANGDSTYKATES